MRVFDRDITRKEFLGCGVVELHSLPHDGSWSDNIVLPLFPQNVDEHTGEAMGFLVVRCAASSALPKTWPPPCECWPDVPRPPPPPPRSQLYLNKVASSTFVYFQVCGARGVPLYKEGEPTNLKATIALNSSMQIMKTSVQEDVLSDSVWIPEVFSFPRTPNSATITVRVYGAMTKLWDPAAWSDLAKDFGMMTSSSSPSDDAAAEGDDDFLGGGAGGTKATKKKYFASGTLIGEVKIPIADLVIGGVVQVKF